MPARKTPLLLPTIEDAFVAIDFETADYEADSACAIGLVRVERMQVVHRESVLIRPPRQRVMFTEVHGITWSMVARADAFVTVWQRLLPLLDGVSLLAAHNAPFDRKVLTACCQSAGVAMPIQPFICTVQIARRRWQQRGNSLPVVCQRLGISLTHHHAGSDAEACARIVIAACATETCPGNE